MIVAPVTGQWQLLRAERLIIALGGRNDSVAGSRLRTHLTISELAHSSSRHSHLQDASVHSESMRASPSATPATIIKAPRQNHTFEARTQFRCHRSHCGVCRCRLRTALCLLPDFDRNDNGIGFPAPGFRACREGIPGFGIRTGYREPVEFLVATAPPARVSRFIRNRDGDGGSARADRERRRFRLNQCGRRHTHWCSALPQYATAAEMRVLRTIVFILPTSSGPMRCDYSAERVPRFVGQGTLHRFKDPPVGDQLRFRNAPRPRRAPTCRDRLGLRSKAALHSSSAGKPTHTHTPRLSGRC